jgi:hypothetical protein
LKLIQDYENQVKRLKEEALKICWYMRGGITYDEAMALSYQERELVNNIVKNNMEVTQKSGLPFF